MKNKMKSSDLKNQFVTHGLAVALKQVGFNDPCFLVWFNKKLVALADHEASMFPIQTTTNSKLGQSTATAPLFQQVQDWFETKGFQVYAFKLSGTWFWKIDDNFSTVEYWAGDGFADKRTALIKAILKGIELVSVPVEK